MSRTPPCPQRRRPRESVGTPEYGWLRFSGPALPNRTAEITASAATMAKGVTSGTPSASKPPVPSENTTTATEKVPWDRLTTGVPDAVCAADAEALIATSVAPEAAPSAASAIDRVA